VFSVVTTTVSAPLALTPSLTISCTMKVPALSAKKLGVRVVGFCSTAVLPIGRDRSDQLN
jgi:hypothetical protein